MKPKSKEKGKPKILVVPVKTPQTAAAGKKSGLLQNRIFLAIVILGVTCVSFLPAVNNDFIPTWDDQEYVTENPLIRSLSMDNIGKMFTTQTGSNYVPLPLLTYAVEYSIWGLNPVPYHITNILLHLLCTLLVFLLLQRLNLSAPFAAAGALLFGIHPMGTESVAWVTERKDLLYSIFYFASLLVYLRYVKAGNRKAVWYVASIGLFVLALFSKIQAVSLPLVLLAADYYLKRNGWLKLLLEKIPYFILSIAFGVAGIFILSHVGALKVNEMFGLTERFFFATYALSAYVLKFFVPVMLSALHPYPGPGGMTLPLLYYLSPLFVLIVAFAVYLTGRKTRAVIFGSLFFLLSIVFMLQLFGAGQGFLADRFTKVPYLGFVFIAGWGLEQAVSKWPRWKWLVWTLLAGYSLAFSIYSYNRCKVWKNGETLWTDVISKYSDRDPRAFSCRGLYYRDENDNERALADFNVALRHSKPDPQIMLMRGNIFFDRGLYDSAYLDYTRVLRIRMDDALALGNLGVIYAKRSMFDSAIICLDRSIRLDSSNPNTFANRAVAYDGLGNTGESIADFKRYLALQPGDERVVMSIAFAYRKLGRHQESLEWMDKAIAIKPEFGDYYLYRSQTHMLLGDRVKARADADRAVQLGVKVAEGYLASLR